MCGVGGVFHFNSNITIDDNQLKEMLKKLSHRGPDASGIKHINSQCALIHTRLSIIDLSAASNQPLTTNENSVLSFNGEIYNYKSLLSELETDHTNNSDTKTLAAGLDKYGVDFLARVDGMFAFAYWNNRDKTLFLARDYLGIKPLYYYLDDDKLVFASEIKSILEYKDINKQLNDNAINEFLQLGYILEPDTAFKNIKQVMPGHYLKITKNGVQEVPLKPSQLNKESNFFDSLKLSVSRRLISDVPLTLLFSGGIDSSLLAKCTPSTIELSHLNLKSNYSEAEKANSYAQKISRKLNVIDSTLDFNLEEIVYYADDLISDPALISNYILYREISKKYKVGLQGDGADELFRGYFTHTAIRLSSIKAIRFFIPLLYICLWILRSFRSRSRYPLKMKIFRFLESYKLGSPLNLVSWRSPFLGELLNNHSSQKYTISKLNKLSTIKDSNPIDIDTQTYLVSNILKKVDRMSMAFGFEVRVPFLSIDTFNAAQRIPEEQKATFFNRKKFLKNLLHDKKVTKQQKDGFGFDLIRFINNYSYEDFLLDNKSAVFFKYISYDKLKKKLNGQYDDYDTCYQIFTLLVFKYWLIQYKVG